MIAANPLLQITAKAGVTSYATARSVALITRVRHRAAAALTDTARTAARWPVGTPECGFSVSAQCRGARAAAYFIASKVVPGSAYGGSLARM